MTCPNCAAGGGCLIHDQLALIDGPTPEFNVDWRGFETWLERGRRAGWISDIACATHDGIPSTSEEEDEWETGGDPCQHVLRLWP